MSDSPGQPLALFPLRSVLFPGGPLPLRIFETRYVDLVRRCLRNDEEFGVVLIASGAEVGASASTVDVGTRARIVDFTQMPDGLLGIVCNGGERFRILQRWQQADGLHMAQVQALPRPVAQPLPSAYKPLADLLAQLLPECGPLYQAMPKHFEDADWVGSRLAELLNLPQAEKQSLLETQDPVRRLAQLAESLDLSVDET